MPCNGDSSEMCGGSSRLSVYTNTAYVAPKIVTTIQTSMEYQGCFMEAVDARAMNAYSFTSTTSMTVELCVNTCLGKGYGYAGVEYGSECYCSNVLPATAPMPDTDCAVMLCPGNKEEWCSNGSRLQVYGPPSTGGITASS